MEERIKKVKQAVQDFINNDPELLDLSAHEQAISHRIAVYLEQIFASEKLNVDCEYNKHFEDPKKIDTSSLNLNLCKECKCHSCKSIIEIKCEKIPKKRFRPDILLHLRGIDDRNFIVIEVKKEDECLFDEAKLKALTKSKKMGGEYGYEIGVFIWFPNNKPNFKWYVNEKQLDF